MYKGCAELMDVENIKIISESEVPASRKTLEYKRRNVSIREDAWKALEDNGITVRKRGERISELILKEYAPKPEVCTPQP